LTIFIIHLHAIQPTIKAAKKPLINEIGAMSVGFGIN